MAEKIKLYNRRLIAFLIGLLVAPFSKMIAGYSDATACEKNVCSPGSVSYRSCGTSKIQAQICASCTYINKVCLDPSCSNFVEEEYIGSTWKDSGTCNSYTPCSAGATSSQACSDEIGSGTQTRTCQAIVISGVTHYLWGGFGSCRYTSCKFAGDVADAGNCYCSTSCPMPNGYGSMIAEVRRSSVCPAVSSSSSDL